MVLVVPDPSKARLQEGVVIKTRFCGNETGSLMQTDRFWGIRADFSLPPQCSTIARGPGTPNGAGKKRQRRRSPVGQRPTEHPGKKSFCFEASPMSMWNLSG